MGSDESLATMAAQFWRLGARWLGFAAATQELGASPGSPASRAETPVDLDATQPVDLDATQPVESQPAGGLLLIGPCDRTAGPQHNPFSNARLRWSTFDFSLRW
jgi:hypothetical protein